MKSWYRSCGVCIEVESDKKALEDFSLRAMKGFLYGVPRFYVLEKAINGAWVDIASLTGETITLKENFDEKE